MSMPLAAHEPHGHLSGIRRSSGSGGEGDGGQLVRRGLASDMDHRAAPSSVDRVSVVPARQRSSVGSLRLAVCTLPDLRGARLLYVCNATHLQSANR